MEPKKNTKADVGRNSSIYFAVGLALMLAVTYLTINYKTYDKSNIDIGQLNIDEELEEEIPITEQIQTPPPPPPPPAAPEVIEIVEDEEDVEETVIESTGYGFEVTDSSIVIKSMRIQFNFNNYSIS